MCLDFHDRRSGILRVVACLSVFGALQVPLLAFEGEIFCDTQGNEIVEAWNVPVGGVPWTMNTGNQGGRIVPGFPRINCTYGGPNDGPGGQSYVRATSLWGQAQFPGGSGGAASSFSFSPAFNQLSFVLCSPAGVCACESVPSMMWRSAGCDGENIITAWEPICTWQAIGGAAVIAVAQVAIEPDGEIVEADVALNTRTVDASGAPHYSFVEYNDNVGTWCASIPMNTPSFMEPIFAYVDLESTVLHELGHVAGLAHSLVEGYQIPSEGTTPTMFQIAHTVSPWTATASVEFNGCQLTTVSLDSASTAMGGLLVATAGTLELDDIHALATTYPVAADPMLGRVDGSVTDALGNPVAGVHVTAIGRYDGEDTRVGVLTRADGSFSFEGLQPGELYAFIEPSDSGGMFPIVTLPNYVFPGCFSDDLCGGGGYTNCGCATVIAHRIEFWDDMESGGEVSPMRASWFTVSANQTTSGIDFVIEPVADAMRAREVFPVTTPFSARGLRINPAAGVDPIVEFEVATGGLADGTVVTVFVGPERVHRNLNGDLLQTSTTVVGGYPVILQGTVPMGGAASIALQLTVTDAMAHHTLLAQGAARTPAGPNAFFITNPVTLFPERP